MTQRQYLLHRGGKNKGKRRRPHVLKIDVEGHDYEVGAACLFCGMHAFQTSEIVWGWGASTGWIVLLHLKPFSELDPQGLFTCIIHAAFLCDRC
jgi:hypothetical protein